MLLNDHQPFNPLYRNQEIDVQLVDARNGYAQLSVVLPIEMTRHFSGLLDSMAGLFRCSDRKARLKQAANKPLDTAKLEQDEKYKQAFSDQVCTLFDAFIAQGLTRNEAISRTNSTLKEQKHPWASYDTIQQTLRKNLRFRKRRKTVN